MQIITRWLAALPLALLAACGMHTDTTSNGSGNGVIQGAMVGAASPMQVGVANAGAATTRGGAFLITGVPKGASALQFSGSGHNALMRMAPMVSGEFRHMTVSLSGDEAMEENEQTETEFEGTVDAINGAVITVAGRQVAVTDATTIRKEGSGAAALADLALGTPVEVEGTLNADGSVTASEIEIEDRNENPADRVTFVGMLAQIDGSTLTVGSTTVHVTSDTKIVKGDTVLALADLKVGDQLLVRGTAQADMSVTATKIRVLRRENEDEDEGEEMHVTGQVAAIDPTAGTFTIGGTVIATDTGTEFEDGLHGLADLKLGDFVLAEVVKRSDGSLLAKEVKQFTPPPMPPLPPMPPMM